MVRAELHRNTYKACRESLLGTGSLRDYFSGSALCNSHEDFPGFMHRIGKGQIVAIEALACHGDMIPCI